MSLYFSPESGLGCQRCSRRDEGPPADDFPGMLARHSVPRTPSEPGWRSRSCRAAGQQLPGHSPRQQDRQGECDSGQEIVEKARPCQATEIRPAKRECCEPGSERPAVAALP